MRVRVPGKNAEAEIDAREPITFDCGRRVGYSLSTYFEIIIMPSTMHVQIKI
jgi:hypothetical protein